ncbi:hypothetical protein HDU92_007786 [Lobulomyces angularis]|nr:hypothetical protein HDU92_007786 [Lobulomyces angularis]
MLFNQYPATFEFFQPTVTSTCTLQPSTIEFSLLATSMVQKLFKNHLSLNKGTGSTHFKVPFNIFVHKTLETIKFNWRIPYLALYYITQLKIKNPKIIMRIGMEYHLFIGALILAQKFLDDNRWTNSTWSRLTGLPLNEVNIMEREILQRLNYNLNVTTRVYDNWIVMINKVINSANTINRTAPKNLPKANTHITTVISHYQPTQRIENEVELLSRKRRNSYCQDSPTQLPQHIHLNKRLCLPTRPITPPTSPTSNAK